ncbi:MAG: hypothetical protein Q8P81_00405 [Nanoarchaeota archaeon]|nr:hypothetical protein [Nanoarchaeota archaeon]
MQERENVLRIFKETKEAMARGDTAKIQSLSNQTTNTASLTQDPDNVAVAVIVYSLGKIIERVDYKELSGWNKFYGAYVKSIDGIIDSLEKEDDEAFRENIGVIRSAISKLSGKLRERIQEVFRKASINKASRLYEHGISMEKTAKLLGVNLYDLASYAGEKEGSEVPESRTVGVRSRLKLAEDMFG